MLLFVVAPLLLVRLAEAARGEGAISVSDLIRLDAEQRLACAAGLEVGRAR
ncbi:hypothetical protein [Sphingomonas pokkalii]|uniref:hypothetical protein n=1 Tax=Sphingomonas pokkalii TaxID=2175090 RepID=UPI00140253F5|nr:hypothetical protein [Sphingomonas pokkalii]